MIRILLAFLVFSFCQISFLKAQETLSLSQAIEIALKNNYDIVISKKNIEAAENQNTQGQAGRYPTISLNLSQPNTASDQIVSASPFQPQGIIISNTLAPSLALNWSIFEGFKVNITKQRFDNLQMESEGNASIIISNTIQAVVLGYYLTSLEKERLDVFRKTLKLSHDLYEYIKLKHDYGSAVTTDLLLEEGNYLTDSINFINQELAFRAALRSLNQLMAVSDIDRTYELTDKIEIPVETYLIEDLEKKMMESNVDLKTKYIGQSVVKHDMELAKSERYPKLSLNGSASNNWGRLDQSQAEFFDFSTQSFVPGPQEILTSENRTYALSFSLTWNLYNGRRINTAIKNAIIREDIGNLEIDKMTLSLRKDLHTDFDNYNIRMRIHNINKRKVEVSELNLQISSDKYKLGAVNSFDFRTVQLNYLTSSLQELNSRYGLLESKVSLMRLTGTILEVYQ